MFIASISFPIKFPSMQENFIHSSPSSASSSYASVFILFIFIVHVSVMVRNIVIETPTQNMRINFPSQT